MSKKSRFDILPEELIRNLYEETYDGKVAITYYPVNGEKPYALTYGVDWTKEDAEHVVKKHEVLVAALNQIGRLYDKLADEPNRKKLLSPEEFSVWETYIRPFDLFDEDLSVIVELYFRGEFDQLDEAENELLERHAEWLEAQSLKRLPMKHRSPKYLIHRAQRYVQLIHWQAPQIVIEEEARCLAEEMVLYYHNK